MRSPPFVVAVLIENRFLSHTVHPNQFPLSLFFPAPHLPLSPRFTSPLFLFQKSLQKLTANQDKTRYNKIRHIPSYRGWTRPPNGVKKSEIHPLPLLGVPQKQANSLTQTQRTWPRSHACLFSLCEPMWVLLSWFWGPCSDSYSLPSLSSKGFSSLLRGETWGDLQLFST